VVQEVVAEVLRRRGSPGWFVGGTVRDRMLGRFSPDVDVVVQDDPRAVAAEVAAALHVPWFPLSARHGAYRVMGPAGHVDVAPLQGGAILDDLAQRDFTINAMAEPVGGGEVVDPFGGDEDLRAGVLAEVSEGIFRADPLRLMRAPRFCHVLHLRLRPSLEHLLRRDAGLVVRAAGERVTNELARTLAEGHSADAVRSWDELGLLRMVLPEADVVRPGRMRVGSQERLAALRRLDGLLARGPDLLPLGLGEAWGSRLASPVDGVLSRPVALRLALMLWGIGSDEAAGVAGRLRLSASMRGLLLAVARCIGSGRCDTASLVRGAQPGRPSVALLWDLEPWEPELLLLASAAHGDNTWSSDDESALPHATAALLKRWAQRTLHPCPPSPVDGETLMANLGMAPGPRLGTVLHEVRLAWEAGEETTIPGLLEVARHHSRVLGESGLT